MRVQNFNYIQITYKNNQINECRYSELSLEWLVEFSSWKSLQHIKREKILADTFLETHRIAENIIDRNFEAEVMKKI